MNPLSTQYNIRTRPADYLPADVLDRIRSGWRGDVIVIFPGTVDLLPFQRTFLRSEGVDVPEAGPIIVARTEVRCVDRGAPVPYLDLMRVSGLWVRVECDDDMARNVGGAS